MGLIGPGAAPAVAALGHAAREMADAFVPNATRAMDLSAEAQRAALSQLGAEFVAVPAGRFDVVVNALNRLPRPMLALGTLGLFVYAMVEPEGFARRMQGLAAVPEPLWWLLGAIVSFYFGAREAHYFRLRRTAVPDQTPAQAAPPGGAPEAEAAAAENPALDLWAHRGGDR
jgi:hypothetical protein